MGVEGQYRVSLGEMERKRIAVKRVNLSVKEWEKLAGRIEALDVNAIYVFDNPLDDVRAEVLTLTDGFVTVDKISQNGETRYDLVAKKKKHLVRIEKPRVLAYDGTGAKKTVVRIIVTEKIRKKKK